MALMLVKKLDFNLNSLMTLTKYMASDFCHIRGRERTIFTNPSESLEMRQCASYSSNKFISQILSSALCALMFVSSLSKIPNCYR